LGNLIATNSEVRKILSDFSVIGRDILARAASHVADSVCPNPDALTNVDRPAPSDRFETAGGSQVGPDETPVAELNVPGSNFAIRHRPHEGVDLEHEGEVTSVSQATDEARERIRDTQNVVVTEAGGTARYGFRFYRSCLSTHYSRRDGKDPNADVDVKQSGFMGRLQNLKVNVKCLSCFSVLTQIKKNGLSDRIPQEHKDTAREAIEQGRKVLVEDYFPEGRRDQFLYRGKKAGLIVISGTDKGR
jgi:hypothetical protein